MNKREILVVSVVLGGVIPILTFVLFWWIGAGLNISQVLPITENGIVIIALAGLVSGIALDAIYLKRWVPRFYEISPKLMLPLYLFASAIMVAFFMGLPLGNIVLGTIAGVYIGRRSNYHREGKKSFSKQVKRAGAFAAIITAGESLPFALLSLNEPIIQGVLGLLTDLDDQAISVWIGVIIMILVIVCVAFLQFWSTSKAAHIAYRRLNNDDA